MLVLPRGYKKQKNVSSGLNGIRHLLHLNTNLTIVANLLPLVKKRKKKKKSELQLQINTLELPLKVQSPWPKPSIQKAFKHMYN